MGSRHATSSTPRRPPSPHVIRVSILLFQGAALRAARGAVSDAAASARAGRAACRPVPARRAAAQAATQREAC